MKYNCPECKQDMRTKPHKGWKDKDCPLCGQGLRWRFAEKKTGKKNVLQAQVR